MSRRQPYDLPKKEDGAKVFWKSLADLNDPAAAQLRAESELQPEARPSTLVKLRKGKAETKENDVSLGRRGFMMFGAASVALAAEGCARRPVEKIMPYTKAPEHVLPGVSSFYATVRAHRGEALGLLVESHEGRPTKVEGNPENPASFGGTDAFAQAGIYDLYDPDRITAPMKGTKGTGGPGGVFTTHTPTPWPELDAAFADIVRQTSTDRGARLRVLMQPTNSPTMIRLRDAFRARYGAGKIHTYAPVHETNAREGSRIAFGQVFNTIPLYSQAKVILSLDSDFLGTEPGAVRASREFAMGRKMAQGAADGMSRLYVVEPTFTNTGMSADHRLRLAAQDVEGYVLALAKTLQEKFQVDLGPVADVAKKAAVSKDIPAKWLDAVAKDLVAARAKSVLVAGSRQPARVHALVHAINGALGNAGHTITYYPAADPFEDDSITSLKELVADMEKGQVGTLVILGGNPVYDAPADIKFADKVKSVMNVVHVSSYLNETGELSQWIVPRAEELEAWGDQRGLDGTVSIQQPLIAPLYLGRSDIEILSRLTGDANPNGYALVQQTTKGSLGNPSNMTRQWNEALKIGRLGPAATRTQQSAIEWKKAEVASALSQSKPVKALDANSLEVTFAPCSKMFDGRYANNPLLLELPDPVNKITWDNVGAISESTAKALNIINGQVVRLTREGGTPVDIAMWITPGQADNSIGLVLGWGRRRAGRYGDRRGFDVGGLRTSDALGFGSGVKASVLDAGALDGIKDKLRKVGMAATDSPAAGRIRPDEPFMVETHVYKISQTQEHDAMEGRPVAIDATLEEYKKTPTFPQYKNEERKDIDLDGKTIPVRKDGSPDPNVLPLWGDWKEDGYRKNHRWGMGIDLTSCTGCNACVIACQVENNVPAVGKEMIWRGREMYWLRIDRYFVGLDPNDPQVVFQPVACVQCEDAPCENVCPVNATEHSPEGLNDMAYNRCIGTRYCANNCPYKVRRFNFLNYHTSGGMYDDVPESEKMHYNPNVTVRMRGVMEKCTYCVQRVQEAKIASKRTGKAIKDKPGQNPGDVIVLQAACQQACASDCIVFGDLNDPEAEVAKWRVKDRAYRLLAELGTHPRTTYLGKIRNLNPEMSEGKGA